MTRAATEPPAGAPRAGVGCVVLDARGRVLLIRRRRPPEAGCWGIPGGKLDFAEPLKAAAARELHEETGLIARGLRLLTVCEQFDGGHWVSPIYRVSGFEGEARLMEPDKHAGLSWFDPADPPRPLTAAARAALAALAASRPARPES